MGVRAATHAGSSMSRGAASFALSVASMAARGGAGSMLSRNGLLLMAAARGRVHYSQYAGSSCRILG